MLALAAALALLAAFAAFLIARAASDDDTPRVSGAPKDVVAAVQSFGRALAARDFGAVCEEMFTVEAREAAGGDRCPSVLQDTAGGLRRPDVRIVAINVRGGTAEVTVRATVAGGPPVTDVIRLVRQDGRFKIVSAGAEPRERREK